MGVILGASVLISAAEAADSRPRLPQPVVDAIEKLLLNHPPPIANYLAVPRSLIRDASHEIKIHGMAMFETSPWPRSVLSQAMAALRTLPARPITNLTELFFGMPGGGQQIIRGLSFNSAPLEMFGTELRRVWRDNELVTFGLQLVYASPVQPATEAQEAVEHVEANMKSFLRELQARADSHERVRIADRQHEIIKSGGGPTPIYGKIVMRPGSGNLISWFKWFEPFATTDERGVIDMGLPAVIKRVEWGSHPKFGPWYLELER